MWEYLFSHLLYLDVQYGLQGYPKKLKLFSDDNLEMKKIILNIIERNYKHTWIGDLFIEMWLLHFAPLLIVSEG